jgi:hypothetical protein
MALKDDDPAISEEELRSVVKDHLNSWPLLLPNRSLVSAKSLILHYSTHQEELMKKINC